MNTYNLTFAFTKQATSFSKEMEEAFTRELENWVILTNTPNLVKSVSNITFSDNTVSFTYSTSAPLKVPSKAFNHVFKVLKTYECFSSSIAAQGKLFHMKSLSEDTTQTAELNYSTSQFLSDIIKLSLEGKERDVQFINHLKQETLKYFTTGNINQ